MVTDVFDQSVLDISWSRDGKVLMACSMDGSIAAVIMSENELGKPLSEEKLHDIMAKTYGKNFKVPVVASRNGDQQTNGTAVVVENPHLLKRKPPQETNGLAPTAAAKKSDDNLKRPKGPTDKQIEARTADGKRRITPIFIPLDEIGSDGAQGSGMPFGSGEFGSSSTKEKSTIEVEKREGIVKPNVSPSKENVKDEQTKTSQNNKSINQEKPKEKKELPAKEKENTKEKSSNAKPEANKKKDNVDEDDDDIPVNIIQVRRKPRVLDSSDDEQPVEKKNEKDKEKERTSVPKPNLVQTRKKPIDDGEESPRPKKRGRPPMFKSKDSDEECSPAKRHGNIYDEEPSVSRVYLTVSGEMEGQAVLPYLTVDRSKSSQYQVQDKKVSVQIFNDFKVLDEEQSSVHLLKFTYTSDLGTEGVTKVLLPSRVGSLQLCSDYFFVTCHDSSLNVFSAVGERLLPPLMLPSPVSKIATEGNNLAAVTVSGRFFQWKIGPGGRPRVVQKDQCILSLLQSSKEKSQVHIDEIKLSKAGVPILVTSVGKSYIFNAGIGTWLKLTDQDNTVFSLSSYSTYDKKPLKGKNLPLESLEILSSMKSTIQTVSKDIRTLADLAYSGNLLYLNLHIVTFIEPFGRPAHGR